MEQVFPEWFIGQNFIAFWKTVCDEGFECIIEGSQTQIKPMDSGGA